MDVCKPLGAGLFFYECLRLLTLVFFLLLAAFENASGGSYAVYMSSNALFPLMALFIWLRPDIYRNYITLYIAGKIVSLVSFYSWEIFTLRDINRGENLANNIVLFSGGALIGLADMLSVWGAWTISKKYRLRTEGRVPAPESGGA
jgi:hypothetical protein